MLKNVKIIVIGAGNVGATIAFNLMLEGVGDEIVLLDCNKELAYAQALDLQHCAEYMNKSIQIYAGDYSECDDADIVIVTAAAPLVPGQTRLDMLITSKKIVKDIVTQINQTKFDGYYIVITNPVDVLSHYIYSLSGFPKNKVIGTGTALDTARLKRNLADLFNVDARSIQAFSIGEHGDSQVIPWSLVRIGGKSLQEVFQDNFERYKDVNLEKIQDKIINLGWEIAAVKRTTNYGISATTVEIIKAIVHNENRVMAISAYLDGEYGVKDTFAGVPAIINSKGISNVIELRLSREESQYFKKSTEVIKNAVAQIEG